MNSTREPDDVEPAETDVISTDTLLRNGSQHDPDATSHALYSEPIFLDVVGNKTVVAVAIGPHVLPSPVIVLPYYAIVPDPVCHRNEYEPHSGFGKAPAQWDMFSRNCKPCPTGSQSPRHSKGIFACMANKGYTGPNGGPFTICPRDWYKDWTGDGHSANRQHSWFDTSCVRCPANSGTLGNGGDDITKCIAKPGSQGPGGGPVELCPPDTYSSEWGALECQACPQGGTTQGRTGGGKDNDCMALPGWTNPNDWNRATFDKCPIGTYKMKAGPFPCKVESDSA